MQATPSTALTVPASGDPATPPRGLLGRLGVVALVALLRLYQLVLSPVFFVLGARCRFYPSCSQYALDAVRLHGPLRGAWYAVRRLGRCHPYCDGGYDPVPPADPPSVGSTHG